jgi:digalactosyldiacylglycerol synthase
VLCQSELLRYQSLCCILLNEAASWVIFMHCTERFIEAADINPHVPESRTHQNLRALLPAFLRTRKLKQNLENASVYLHQALSGLEVTLCAFGAVPKTLQLDEHLCKHLGLAR